MIHAQEQYKDILLPLLPANTTDAVIGILQEHKIFLRITRSRRSKKGDYRWPRLGSHHKISINGNLNPYEFYITFLHELAHLYAWNKYKNSIKPHGLEWKIILTNLFFNALKENVFTQDINNEIIILVKKMEKGVWSESKLMRCLKTYDNKTSNDKMLEEIEVGKSFYCNGRMFRKVKKIRTRYQCLCLNNNRVYSFHPLASVRIE